MGKKKMGACVNVRPRVLIAQVSPFILPPSSSEKNMQMKQNQTKSLDLSMQIGRSVSIPWRTVRNQWIH